MSVTRSQIRAGHNTERQANGLRNLSADAGLDKSAQRVAGRLARRDAGIEHAKTWWKVIDRMTRARYGAKGENLADGFSSVDSLMSAWMHSPLHRRNVLSRKFSKVGVGIATAQSGQTYYVVHFGGR